jgi:molecular chaperone IbpA
MRSFDLTPLFRSTVGFDGLTRMLDSVNKLDDQAFAYPPYNIEKHGDDAYRITMAVAGFGENDLNIVSQDNTLIVSGKTQQDDKAVSYLHRGIAGRAFERRFQLAQHIRVSGASLKDGLLHIELQREVPEAMKPRAIKIETATKPALNQQAA